MMSDRSPLFNASDCSSSKRDRDGKSALTKIAEGVRLMAAAHIDWLGGQEKHAALDLS